MITYKYALLLTVVQKIPLNIPLKGTLLSAVNTMLEELNKTDWYHRLWNLSLVESRDALTDTLNTLIEINISESKFSPAVSKRRFYVK